MSFLKLSDTQLITTSMITNSGAASGFEDDYLVNDNRGNFYQSAGNFTIGSTNNKIYINDGSDKTITLTSANYTATSLATHIQTQLNASSSTWTATYTLGKFILTRGSSAVLRLSVTTNSAASTIGFTTLVNLTNTTFTADAYRIHTSEYILVDFGAATEPDLFFIVAPKNYTWLSSTAVIKLQANASDSWGSPSLDVTLEFDSHKSVYMIDQNATRSYRYWRVLITDIDNYTMEFFRASYLFIGDYISLSSRNISSGFTKSFIDQSTQFTTDTGVKNSTDRPIQEKYTGLMIPYLTTSNRATLQEYFISKKKITPFLAILDGDVDTTIDVNDMSVWGRLVDIPSILHIKGSYYSMKFDIEEAL